MDAQCDNAKMLMQSLLQGVHGVVARLPAECASAVLREVEDECHRQREALIVADERCECLLPRYTQC